jgi:alpha-1,3-rhamnosyl/mannosyltransferase
MKIAVDIRHLATAQPSGIGRYTIEILERMTKLSKTDQFLLFSCGSNETLSKLPKFNGKNIAIIKHNESSRIISSKLLFTAHTLDDFLPQKPDIWFFPNINIIKTHRPYAITIHDLSFELFPNFFTSNMRLWHKLANPRNLTRNASAILSVSENTKNNLSMLWGIQDNKITTTPLGVSDDFTQYEQPCDKNHLQSLGINFPYILSLCSLEPRKNIETIIEAYGMWRDANTINDKESSIMHLVLAGGNGWKNSQIHKLINSSRYKSFIHALGFITENQKPTLYRHAKLFVFPSFFEGFGLPIVEALASGTPVISSFSGSMQEVGKEHVIYVDPYNMNDLSLALNVALEQKKENFTIPSNIYSWDATARRTLGVLHAVK